LRRDSKKYNYIKEAVDSDGFLGLFMGGLKSSAIGISAALVFGYIASIIFPHSKG